MGFSVFMDLLTGIPGIVKMRETGDGQGVSRFHEILNVDIFILK